MGLYERGIEKKEEIEKLIIEAIKLKIRAKIPLTEEEKRKLTQAELRDIDLILKRVQEKLDKSDSS